MPFKPLCLCCALVLLPGCFELRLRCGGDDEKGSNNEMIVGMPRPGARVVGRWGDAFHPATVLEVRPGVATVIWDELQPPERALPASWLVEQGSGPGKTAAGRWLLCRHGSKWQLCQARALGADRWRVRDIDGLERRVDRRDLLPVPVGLRDWAARHGAQLVQEAMAKRAMEHLVPASAGKPVRVGRAVLGRWASGGWYEARVVAIGEELITLAWKDGSAQQATPPDGVAPLHRVKRFAHGDLLFCRWHGSGWWKARMLEPLADGQRAEIRYSDGSVGRVEAADCVGGRVDPGA